MSDGDPAEPLLSPEESEALLQAMQAEVADPDAEPAALGRIEPRLARMLPKAREAAAQTCPALAAQLLRTTGRRYDVVPGEPQVAVVTSEIDPTSVDARWNLVHDDELLGWVTLDHVLVRSLLNSRLGGSEHNHDDSIARPPTGVELRILEPIARAAIAPVLAALIPDIALALGRPDPFSPPTRPTPMLVLPVLARDPESMVARLMIALDGSRITSGKTLALALDEEKKNLAVGIAGVEVELVARLGGAFATIRSVMELEVGSVVRLDSGPGDLLEVRIHDLVAFRGAPVVQAGNLALEIEPPMTEQEAAA